MREKATFLQGNRRFCTREVRNISLFLIPFLIAFLLLPAIVQPWTFAVVGDTQGVSPQEPVSPVFDRIIEKVNQTDCEFLIHLGDRVSGATDPERQREQFLIYLEKRSKLKVPVYEVPGNHDLPVKEVGVIYQELISPFFYHSFDHKNCHFVLLSSEMITGLAGGLGEEQLAWLEDDLRRNITSSKIIFVFIHRPLYRGLIHPYPLKDAKRLAKILKRYKARYIFAGHEHRFGIARRGAIIEYISGGGGAPLLNFSEENGGYYHFLLVRVEQGKVEVSPVRIDYPKVYQNFGVPSPFDRKPNT